MIGVGEQQLTDRENDGTFQLICLRTTTLEKLLHKTKMPLILISDNGTFAAILGYDMYRYKIVNKTKHKPPQTRDSFILQF